MSIEVRPYSRYSGKVVSVGGITYNIKTIPEEFTLVANIINEETEERIVNLINNNKNIELKEIMKCIASEFQGELRYKLNEFTFGKIKAGEGMQAEKEDPKYYNPCLIVMNLGSDIEIVLFDPKIKRQIPIILPRRSMFLLQDTQFKYQRIISKRFIDIINNEEIKRGDRYSLVFKSRK
jgi:hypothetical protein